MRTRLNGAALRLAVACSTLFLLSGAHAETVQTVRIAVAHYSDQTLPYFEKAARDFSRAHPGIRIKIEEVNWDSLQQKLQTDIIGGINPDLSVVGTRWLLDLVQDDVIDDLDGRMSPVFREKFIGRLLDAGKVHGRVYGLPIAAPARGLFYNKDLLAKAGYPNGPKTWDEVIAAATVLKKSGSYGFGLQGKEIETDIYWYYALWSQGGEVLDKEGKSAFAGPAGIKAAQLYKTLVDQGLTQPGVTSYSREDVQNLFKQGRVGMVITAPFLAKQIAKENPSLDYGVTAVPAGTTSATYAATDSLVLFKNSRVKGAAWQFAEYLFSKAPRVAFSSGEGFLPTTKEEATDPVFADPITQSFIAFLPSAKFAPPVAGWEDLAKIVSNAMQAVYIGKAQPEQALKTAAVQADKMLSK